MDSIFFPIPGITFSRRAKRFAREGFARFDIIDPRLLLYSHFTSPPLYTISRSESFKLWSLST